MMMQPTHEAQLINACKQTMTQIYTHSRTFTDTLTHAHVRARACVLKYGQLVHLRRQTIAYVLTYRSSRVPSINLNVCY